MKAAVLERRGELAVRDVPEPEREGWALVQTRAAGICGTELHILDAMFEPPSYPFVIGHEASGVVLSAPAASPVAPGQRVAIYNMIGCGSCKWCRSGNDQVCTDPTGQLGFTLDGTFSDLIAVPARNLVPLPDAVSFEDAALLSCAGMTAVHAVRLAGVSLGETAVVDGVGGVGLMVIQVAKAAGARVLAVADSDEKAALAEQVGAYSTVVLDEAGYDAVADRVRELTDGAGSDHFFELVGTGASMLAGIRALARRGTFVSIGYTPDELKIHPVELILSEARIVSSVAASQRDLEAAVQLAADGRITTVIDTRYLLADVAVGLERLRARQVMGRNVLVWPA
ncbi:MAG TPA: zinc-binding dehydrogenase [Acidimicrobiales bacterium]|nr:zinc-binding dehydrogenase [Acidimicrobiales bacterium]